jgi:hypothetical protein
MWSREQQVVSFSANKSVEADIKTVALFPVNQIHKQQFV